MDWTAIIKAGKASVRVTFSGGAMTRHGVIPAEFATSNRFMQTVIENSDYYKTGRIRLLRSIQLDEDLVSEKPGVKSEEMPAPGPVANEVVDEGDEGENVVAVTCLEDAQTYLKEHYGVPMHKTSSKAKCIKEAQQYGVIFKGL